MTPTGVWAFARRWLWFFALALLLTAGISFAISIRLPKVYAAWTRLQVTPGQASKGMINYDALLAAERLTRTYSEMVNCAPS